MGGGLVLVPRGNTSIRLGSTTSWRIFILQRGQAQGPHIHSTPPPVPTGSWITSPLPVASIDPSSTQPLPLSLQDTECVPAPFRSPKFILMLHRPRTSCRNMSVPHMKAPLP